MAKRPRWTWILLLMLAVPLATGFLLSETTESAVLAVDLRKGVDRSSLLDDLAESRDSEWFPLLVISGTGAVVADSCVPKRPDPEKPSSRSAYCDLRVMPGTIIIVNDDLDVSAPELLRSLYGPDLRIEPGNLLTTGVRTTSTGFNGVAAFLTAVLVATVALLLGSRSRGGVRQLLNRLLLRRPATATGTSNSHSEAEGSPNLEEEGRPKPKPTWIDVPVQPASTGAPPTATGMVEPATASARAIPSSTFARLANRAGGHAIARTHVDAGGGYVAVGTVLVWAVTAPSTSVAVVPDDPLTVVGVDEQAEALVVAPAHSAPAERRHQS